MRCYGYGPTATAPFHLSLMGSRATKTPMLKEEGAKGATTQGTKSPFLPSSSTPWDRRDPARGGLSSNPPWAEGLVAQEEPQTCGFGWGQIGARGSCTWGTGAGEEAVGQRELSGDFGAFQRTAQAVGDWPRPALQQGFFFRNATRGRKGQPGGHPGLCSGWDFLHPANIWEVALTVPGRGCPEPRRDTEPGVPPGARIR